MGSWIIMSDLVIHFICCFSRGVVGSGGLVKISSDGIFASGLSFRC